MSRPAALAPSPAVATSSVPKDERSTSPSWLAAARRAIAESEYHASMSGAELQAPNRAHDLRTYFDASGIRIHDRTAEGSPKLFELRLAAVGRGETTKALESGEVESEAGRVEIRREGLVEWYVNSAAGLEQGFTLTERPAGEGTIRLELGVSGAEVAQRGADLRFRTETGRDLDYGKLAAFDAEGNSLDVAFRRLDPSRFAIEVGDEGATYPIVIDPLISEVAVARITSDQDSAYLGLSASNAGDVNGDGYDDVIVGATAYDSGGGRGGAAFVFLGSSAGIGSATPAMAHARLTSNQTASILGRSVSGAGDVNGDGYDDVIVGSPWFDDGQTDEGAAFVFLGSAIGIVDGTTATAHARITSDQVGAQLGFAVSSAGDVNGDGYDDVIIGAFSYDDGQTNEGAAFVFLGSPTGIATGTPSTADGRITSNQTNAYLGGSVSSAGDINGDGIADIIVGAGDYDDGEFLEGAAFIFLGGTTGVSSGSPATAHARITSNQAFAGLGRSVSGAGDVNGDGFDDVIVGATEYDDGEVNEGAAFVFLGGSTGMVNGSPATAHARFTSDQIGAGLGASVSDAGDVNGDGYDDVIIGTAHYNDGELEEGAAFVFLGSQTGIASRKAGMADGRLTSNQVLANLGVEVSGAGDVNGDGFDDVIAGAYGFDDAETDEGAAFVYLGSPMTWNQDFAFAHANLPTTTSYDVNPFYSYNSVTGATAHVDRLGVGIYDVTFPGFEAIEGGGNVQVSQAGTSGGYCNVEVWGPASARIRCFNASGVASDQQFSVLYLKVRPSTKAAFYAWSGTPPSASYTPNAAYSNNPAGGAITAQRLGTGVYSMTWSGAGAIGVGGGHVQVTAYGSSNRRCKVGIWSDETVEVDCFDPAGNPADTAYSILYLRPRAQDEGVAFAWANASTATSTYMTDPAYAFNPIEIAPTSTRLAVGTYDVVFDNFHTQGTGGGHVQVTAYGLGDTRCSTYGFTAELVRVNCFDSAGALVDSQFDVLSLRPIALPEPGIAIGLGASVLGPATLRRRRALAVARRDRAVDGIVGLLRRAVIVSLLVLAVGSAQAFDIQPDLLVYQEDFLGELSIPTTPEVDTIDAGGLVESFLSEAPPLLVGGDAALFPSSIVGTGSSEVLEDAKVAVLPVRPPAILGARSMGVRSRFANLAFSPGPGDVEVAFSFGSLTSWDSPGVGIVYVACSLVFTQDASGLMQASLVVFTLDSSGFQVVSEALPQAQAADLLGGTADLTLDLIADFETSTFSVRLIQAGWPTRAVSIAASPEFTGPAEGLRVGAGLQLPAGSFDAATASVDLDFFEVYAEPQTFVVDTLLDRTDLAPGNGACAAQGDLCSLRAAIQESNALPGRQRIIVPAGTYGLTRAGADEDLAATGDLDILGDLEIVGAGAGSTIVDGGRLDRVFEIQSGVSEPSVSISGLTIRGGVAATALGAVGGGIQNAGSLTLSDCEVSGNAANLAGGIMNRRELVMERCVVRDNEALPLGFTNARAGGIASASTSAGGTSPIAEIRHSAIVGNRAPVAGGLELGNCLSARIENTTIAENQGTQVAVFNCDAYFHHATITSASGTALSAGSFSGTNFVVFVNSVFEGSPACNLSPTLPVVVDELGVNASSDASCGLALSGDVIGVPLGLSALVPTLGSKAKYPLPGSPLIDREEEGFTCLADDQLGTERPLDGDGDEQKDCDLGAIEVALPEPGVGAGIALGVLAIAGRSRRSRRRRNAPTADGIARWRKRPATDHRGRIATRTFAFAAIASVACLIVLGAAPSRAADGVVEINNVCAVSTGCFSGDTAGFPVTIDGSAGRSYRLTSDLVVPDHNTHGIVVSGDDVGIIEAGIYAGLAARVADNTCDKTMAAGIRAGEGANITGNSCSFNSGNGIQAIGGGRLVFGNTVRGNDG